MVSAYAKGTYRMYIQAPSGARRLVRGAPAYWWCLTGSSEGVVAQTSEKWNFLPLSNIVGTAGYSIVVTYEGTAVTFDASDGVWIIPLEVNGQAQTIGNSANASGLGNNNFTVDLAPADTVVPANIETPVAMYRAKEGVRFRLGGDRVFMSIEDNA